MTPVDPETVKILQQLLALMGSERLSKLLLLMKDIINDTQYGDVKIVIADGRVVMLKTEKSYK